MTVGDLWTALALMAVIEGVIYALFPTHIKRMMEMARLQSDDTLRMFGLAVAFLGVASLWALRG